MKKKVAAAVLAAGVLLSFTGCKASESQKKSTRKTRVATKEPEKLVPPTTSESDPTKSLDELKSIDGPMLIINCENVGPFDYYQDESRDCSFTLYYNGELERICSHSMSDPVNSVVTVSDYDYYRFYQFCMDYGDGKAFAGYSEDVCDGTMYGFSYYDEDGQRNSIYFGYCYQVQVLQDIADLASDYFYPDYSIPCQNRIGAYEGLLDTVTNLSCPEIQKLDELPEDVVLEAGVGFDHIFFYYEYTYTTTEDAEKGPIVCYVSNYGNLVAMKNNRNWDVIDLLIEVNGQTLTAQWDPAYYNTSGLMKILYEQGSFTVELTDWEFGKEANVGSMDRGTLHYEACEPGMIIMCMNDQCEDIFRIVTVDGECDYAPLAKINSVTSEELQEIFGEGPVTVTIKEAHPADQ